MKQQFLAGIFILNSLVPVCGQELVPGYREWLESCLEDMAEQYEGEVDISTLIDRYDDYLVHPLNLNQATSEQLAELEMLNDFQILALIDYRNRIPLLSIYELLYIPGYNEEIVQRLMPLVTCEEQAGTEPTLKEMTNYISHNVLVRYQRILEKQEGYFSGNDTTAEDDETKHYLGTPDKLYIRYIMNVPGRLQFVTLMEKDEGEECFSGSNRTGFDFYSASLQYRSASALIRHVVIGDYHVQLGQGLLVHTRAIFGKSSDLIGFARSPAMIKGNRSPDESSYFRGGSIECGLKNWTLIIFTSLRNRDASLTGTCNQGDTITTLLTSGLHNTLSALGNKKTVKEQIIGGNIRYDQNRLRLGVNLLYHHFDKYWLPQDQLYKVFDFSGQENMGLSTDYRYIGRKFQVFGETAWSNSAPAVLTGALFFVHSSLNLAILHRYYSRSYHAAFAHAFSEGSSVSNEHGCFLGADFQMGKHSIDLYTDFFSFPWMRYRVNNPSSGCELMAQWSFNFRNCSCKLRFRHEQKERNQNPVDNIYRVAPIRKEQLKWQSRWNLTRNIDSGTRLEFDYAGQENKTGAWGCFVAQDMDFSIPGANLEIWSRLAFFNTRNYDVRIYAWEKDLLYTGGTGMLYGRGWHSAFIVVWKPVKPIRWESKLTYTWYPDEEQIGSGLNAIAANHRTRFKMQLIVSF